MWVQEKWLKRICSHKIEAFKRKHTEPEDIADVVPSSWCQADRVVAYRLFLLRSYTAQTSVVYVLSFQ